VNGVYQALTENSGTYSFTIANVTEAKNINLTGYYFAENVLPVTYDSEQRQSDAPNQHESQYYENLTVLETRYSYSAIPILVFTPTQAQKAAGYNKATLKLVPVQTFGPVNYSVRSIPDNINIYTIGSGSATTLRNNGVIVSGANEDLSFIANTPTSFNVTGNYVLDMPDEIRLSVIKTSNTTMHTFHSLENGNPAYIPVLVFEKELSTGITGAGVDKDPVTSLKYYDLTGREIVNPSEKGVYIIQKTYLSGKKTTGKTILL
jgi:hypothetical protein